MSAVHNADDEGAARLRVHDAVAAIGGAPYADVLYVREDHAGWRAVAAWGGAREEAPGVTPADAFDALAARILHRPHGAPVAGYAICDDGARRHAERAAEIDRNEQLARAGELATAWVAHLPPAARNRGGVLVRPCADTRAGGYAALAYLPGAPCDPAAQQGATLQGSGVTTTAALRALVARLEHERDHDDPRAGCPHCIPGARPYESPADERQHHG